MFTAAGKVLCIFRSALWMLTIAPQYRKIHRGLWCISSGWACLARPSHFHSLRPFLLPNPAVSCEKISTLTSFRTHIIVIISHCEQDFPFHLADFVQRARVCVAAPPALISHQINCRTPYEWAKLHSVMFTRCAFMPTGAPANLAKSADKNAPGAKIRNKNVIYLRLPRHRTVSGLADSNGTL